MNSLPTVLIFTYPEYGQANVNLATSYELALAGVNVYIASFPSLRTRISRLQELIDRHASRSSGKPTGSVVFCECKGITPPVEATGKHGVNIANLPHPPGLSDALESYSKLDVIFVPWDQEEYLAVTEGCKEIIATIKPNVVVVDTLFCAALDACKLVDQKCMVMSPVGIKEAAASVQPYLADIQRRARERMQTYACSRARESKGGWARACRGGRGEVREAAQRGRARARVTEGARSSEQLGRHRVRHLSVGQWSSFVSTVSLSWRNFDDCACFEPAIT